VSPGGGPLRSSYPKTRLDWTYKTAEGGSVGAVRTTEGLGVPRKPYKQKVCVRGESSKNHMEKCPCTASDQNMPLPKEDMKAT